ncbi:Uncharacterized iron-regulated membrane protein [Chitinophaga jiangningensis]|uniref:Uncharacterized iron-regulated membrane protein n=1 Tax=Chitinophaga jiangningensis TaxID=1419482 RepID=A0A1M7FRA2_9BACT|nr:PepSY-associated TM helix domain-containing protein [Chitinophaga jiangningensis]SHM06611.1 Uncharacterized iron-regulated membrane protein [Chitinophaga jiangningensis]
MKKIWSKQVFRVHRLAGLIAGLLLLLISITGSMLVFSDELDEALYHNNYHISPGNHYLPVQQQFQAVRNRLQPDQPYLMVTHLPQSPTETTIIRAEYNAEKKIYFFVNPYTAQIVAQRGNTDYFMGKVLFFHFTLLSGKTGAQIILITAILLAVSLLTGIWIYRHAFGKVLTFRVKPEWSHRNRRWRNLHRIIGVWAILFNLVMVITGIIMVQKVIDSRKGKLAPTKEIPSNLDYDQLVAEARKAIPGLTVMGIRPPKKADAPIRILGHAGEARIWGEFASSVYFDNKTGNIQKIAAIHNAKLADKFAAIVPQLHFGNYGGLPLKIIWSLFGLAPGLLSISGCLIWYRRKFILKQTTKHHP